MAYSQAADSNNAQRSSPNIASQARGAIAVTPSDTADLAMYAKALYIGVSGDLSVIPVGNYSNGNATPVLFKNVPVGWFPVQVARVMAANTTASSIVAVSA